MELVMLCRVYVCSHSLTMAPNLYANINLPLGITLGKYMALLIMINKHLYIKTSNVPLQFHMAHKSTAKAVILPNIAFDAFEMNAVELYPLNMTNLNLDAHFGASHGPWLAVATSVKPGRLLILLFVCSIRRRRYHKSE